MKVFKVIECRDCRFYDSTNKKCNFLDIYTSPIAFCSIGEDKQGNYCKAMHIVDDKPNEEPVCDSCKIEF